MGWNGWSAEPSSVFGEPRRQVETDQAPPDSARERKTLCAEERNFTANSGRTAAADCSARSGESSMAKVANPREHHAEAMLIAGVDRLLVAHGTAGLNDRRHPG